MQRLLGLATLVSRVNPKFTPNPKTQNPNSLHTKPQTPNPKPITHTLNPKPETINARKKNETAKPRTQEVPDAPLYMSHAAMTKVSHTLSLTHTLSLSHTHWTGACPPP